VADLQIDVKINVLSAIDRVVAQQRAALAAKARKEEGLELKASAEKQLKERAAQANLVRKGSAAEVEARLLRSSRENPLPIKEKPPTPYKEQPAAKKKAIVKADYYVITYGFTSGRDLDTRTFLVNPNNSDLLGPVGWCKDSIISFNDQSIVVFGGDNTGTGVESVLFDRLAYEAAFGRGSRYILSLNAFWYNEKGSNVTITITGYKGGIMIPTDYAWTNPTATKVWENFSTFTSNAVQTNEDDCIDGDFITYLGVNYNAGSVNYFSSL
jgi:hypothetical protein